MKPALILLVLLLRETGISATAAQQQPEITFRTASNLVLVDVIALKNGLPDKTLQRDDFQVFDNGRPVTIKTFDSGATFTTRPLAIWFVVQCHMQGWEREGSGLFAGQISLFKPALKDLDQHDTVAVAHWCDNGDSRLDLLPTSNVEELTTTLEDVLALAPETSSTGRPGELALQKTLQLIVDATRSSKPEPLPAVIFLYGDYSGMPKSEANHFVDEMLETSAIAFGLKDHRSPGIWLIGEQAQVAKYIATQTGGQYLKVIPETYADGLGEILRQLHGRYQLGFQPDALDGKRHKLRVELVGTAKNQHKGVRLRNRAAYVPVAAH